MISSFKIIDKTYSTNCFTVFTADLNQFCLLQPLTKKVQFRTCSKLTKKFLTSLTLSKFSLSELEYKYSKHVQEN